MLRFLLNYLERRKQRKEEAKYFTLVDPYTGIKYTTKSRKQFNKELDRLLK